MSDHLKFYIDGQWVEPSASDTFDVINPATEQPIGKIAMGGVEDVNNAVAAAKAAFPAFAQTSKQQRIELLVLRGRRDQSFFCDDVISFLRRIPV